MDRKLTQILVIHPGALGDTILALPVLAALKAHYHPATVCFIGHSLLIDVLPGRSTVDMMKSIEGREYQELLEGHGAMSSASRAFFQQFDVAVVWTADQDGCLHESLCRLGTPTVVVQSPRLGDESSRHATDRFKDTLGHMLGEYRPPQACLTPTGEDRKAASVWLSGYGVNADFPLVAVHPGSGSPAKCWPPEQFAEAVIGLMRDGVQVLLIEGPADTSAVHTLQESLPAKLPRLHHASLCLVLGVLSHCSAFLGNDSGVTQMAAALGLPTVAVFGPTDPAVWGFRCSSVLSLRGDSCRCSTREMQRACENRPCLSIPPEIVLDALRDRLRAVSLSLATAPPLC